VRGSLNASLVDVLKRHSMKQEGSQRYSGQRQRAGHHRDARQRRWPGDAHQNQLDVF